jgi:hypothetical protein
VGPLCNRRKLKKKKYLRREPRSKALGDADRWAGHLRREPRSKALGKLDRWARYVTDYLSQSHANLKKPPLFAEIFALTEDYFHQILFKNGKQIRNFDKT